LMRSPNQLPSSFLFQAAMIFTAVIHEHHDSARMWRGRLRPRAPFRGPSHSLSNPSLSDDPLGTCLSRFSRNTDDAQ
jgi:hypothetical protein